MSSSSTYKQFEHLRIPLEVILSATDNFSDANQIRGDQFGKDYKGQLLLSGQLIDIVARRFDDNTSQGLKEFWMEVWMLSKLKHKNIVSIVGFCDENGEKIVINKHETRGSLHEYLRDPTLTWMRRLEICVGVAHALSYMYYDSQREFSVIHRDIKSSRILLDDQWEAKLSGFEFSLYLTAARRSRLLLSEVYGTWGYCDPTYIMSGSVTHKSDMYSFGLVLFELLCGKEATTLDKENRLLASSARSHYKRGKLEDVIDPVLWKQMNTKSFEIFSEIAYYCLKKERQHRPNINQIVRKLEQALVFQREHENPLITSKPYPLVSSTMHNRLKGKDLKHLQIPLFDIELATGNFSKAYLIGSGGYGEVYKAELDHLDSKKFLQLEEKNICELPKKCSTVAIKRIKIREDQQGKEGFLAEIEMLSNCKHPNIVSLLGYCEEGDHMILVYEHASYGSLDTYLGGTDKLDNLSWVQRIKICIDIACGLNYLHTKIEDERRIIHRDIKSDNILLSENWQAKIADFGLSKFRPWISQQVNQTLYTQTLAGTELYWDPEYFKTGKLKNESDIYSFGVVLFEIFSGRFANDPVYTKENSNGIAAVARRHFNEGTIREMVDPRLNEETHEYIHMLERGPHKDSLDAFTKIAYQCVAESQADRPTAQDIIKKLEEALYFQENIKDQLKFSLEDIYLATQNFSDDNLIGRGGFGKVHRGEVTNANGRHTIAVKRLDKSFGQGEPEFLMELEIFLEYKHENIIGLVGYCNEMDERIILYEYASRGSLYKHLSNYDLTWLKRLEICIDIASGLDFLHSGGITQEVVIHRDIKSANILLNDDWKAKISDFGLSVINPMNKDIDFVIDNVVGTFGYVDPLYVEWGFLSPETDIYSLGVVFLEILSGRSIIEMNSDRLPHDLTSLYKDLYKKGKLDEIVFEGIKIQIAPISLETFQSAAIQCLNKMREERPTACAVLQQLNKALEFQEDYEIWEPKLPKDYKDIFQMSHSPDICHTQRAKDLYNMLCNGILLQQGKLLFTLHPTGERNGMISAKMFSYVNRSPHKWRSVPESRFQTVAEMLDILNLKIKIKTRPQLLSPDVVYGVYLVFKFSDPIKVSNKPVYVNLKYKYGRRSTSHAYFATWRDNEWMMIELCRFLNNNIDIVFKFLLESFSRYYCGYTSIYVEGIEFRAIDMNVKHEEIKEVQQILKSDSNMNLLQHSTTNLEEINKGFKINDGGEKLFLLNEVKGKKHLMLSPNAALYNYSDKKLFKTKPSTEFSFPNVIELLPQQVFRINCKIKSEMLSTDTEYVCYLVFKLSEKCCGLHCPVKVRDLLHRNNKEVEIIYFRSPRPWNLHHTNQAPQQREDGWMEVKIWKLNLNHQLIKNDCFRVNLKLITYEGTMSGLIVCGLEFRPT